MPSFTKLMEEVGEGVKAETKAIDDISKSLQALNFKKAQDEVDALTEAQMDLRKQLDLLKEQAQLNVKITKERLKAGLISGRKADKLLKQQQKALTDLNKEIEEEKK